MPATFSFPFGHRWLALGGWRLAFLVYSEDNVYTPHPDALEVQSNGETWTIRARRLGYAGLQQSVSGEFLAQVRALSDGLECSIQAGLAERIKGTTLLLASNRPTQTPTRDYGDEPAAATGCVLSYPRHMRFPVFPLRHADGRYTAIASLDEQVRGKTVAVTPVNGQDEEVVLELHHHEDARQWSVFQRTPTWRVLRCRDPRPLFEARCQIAQRAWGLQPWETRPDVPDWMRRIGLVLNLHGTHWTGYVFNTYEQQLQIIRHVVERMDGDRVLTFLTAWDGRYNYNWPRYEPDERMGGADGLLRLVRGAQELGVHVIPQIGAVSANRRFLPPALHDCASQDAYGNTYVKDVDWDNDRIGDTYRVNANIGHPAFRQFLLDRTFAITDQFGFDGIFLDINMGWHNDPRFNICEGHQAFAHACRQRYDSFLLFGENWYDGLMPAYPLVHSVTDQGRGILQQWPDVFDRYCRTTYHLIHPAPGSGSTGVYEAGYRQPFVPDPAHAAIPAISFVNDTLPRHAAEVDQRIAAAASYIRRHGL